ncbi:MAG: hypothetical protein HOW73_43405 [Polyangiaceae bacterium]|nr:hypothetical protein [Polyangiaceae bacterium]
MTPLEIAHQIEELTRQEKDAVDRAHAATLAREKAQADEAAADAAIDHIRNERAHLCNLLRYEQSSEFVPQAYKLAAKLGRKTTERKH